MFSAEPRSGLFCGEHTVLPFSKLHILTWVQPCALWPHLFPFPLIAFETSAHICHFYSSNQVLLEICAGFTVLRSSPCNTGLKDFWGHGRKVVSFESSQQFFTLLLPSLSANEGRHSTWNLNNLLWELRLSLSFLDSMLSVLSSVP